MLLNGQMLYEHALFGWCQSHGLYLSTVKCAPSDIPSISVRGPSLFPGPQAPILAAPLPLTPRGSKVFQHYLHQVPRACLHPTPHPLCSTLALPSFSVPNFCSGLRPGPQDLPSKWQPEGSFQSFQALGCFPSHTRKSRIPVPCTSLRDMVSTPLGHPPSHQSLCESLSLSPTGLCVPWTHQAVPASASLYFLFPLPGI